MNSLFLPVPKQRAPRTKVPPKRIPQLLIFLNFLTPGNVLAEQLMKGCQFNEVSCLLVKREEPPNR